jgi:NADH:ubiquinone oxidoreductase subunit 4 (subunit M)
LAATPPARLLARARSFALAAFAGMAMTGAVLFSAEASHLAVNQAFQLKAALVAAGLVNIAIYELWARRAVERLQPGAPMPPRAKIAGMFSLGIWVAVAACGRSIAYF